VNLAGVAPSSATTGLLNANSMIINGVQIGQALSTDDTASDVNATSSTRAASAIAIAAAINRTVAVNQRNPKSSNARSMWLDKPLKSMVLPRFNPMIEVINPASSQNLLGNN